MPSQFHFHPIIQTWFERKFGGTTDVQRQAWASIREGAHTLIAAPTGSGKTLAALLPLLDEVLKEKLSAGKDYKRGVRVLYVTPLKALNNDIHQHLFDYMDELQQTAEVLGMEWPGIAVGVRTGDTTQSTRASMLRRPPDVLVTTPESLFILLTTQKASTILRLIRHVVVDEIHNIASGDRGMHFTVTLERLSVLCGQTPQRIGVSATQKPPERIAQFLGGWEEPDSSAIDSIGDGMATVLPRKVAIVESMMDRAIELTVSMPQITGIRGKNEDVWTPLIKEILRHLEGAGSTLIFVNNRRMCERLTSRLNEMVSEDFSRSHHGSVSRERRLETEQMLRSGELRCLVATSSLELGIDVGFVDLVLQIDSPLSAASGIQRIGRAGHAVGGVSRGTIIARHRGDLPEIAVLAERIARRDTDEIQVPRYGAGVLAQQIVAIVAVMDRCTPDDVYSLIQRSDSYKGFSRERFDGLLEMMSGFYPFVRPHIDWDKQADMLVRRPGSSMAAIMGAGTIPQSTGYPVYHAEQRIHLGELDEEYIFETRVGDVFQLGTSTWRIRSIREDRVEVVESDAAFGEIPFWRAEGPGRTYELSVEIGVLMERLLAMMPESEATAMGSEQAIAWLTEYSWFSSDTAESLISLLKSQRAVSAWPTHKRVVIEWFTDDSGLTHLVIHSWFGRKINLTWMIAIGHYFEQMLHVSFETTVKDNGMELIFREWDPAWLGYLQGVNSESVESLLLEAIPTSPLFAAVFRKTAETALLFSRSFRRTPGWLKRLRGQELLKDALPYGAKFPLVQETLRECMEQSLDLPRLKDILMQLESGEIERKIIQLGVPSPLAVQFFYDYLNRAIYESDSLTRELQQRMLGISKELAAEVFGKEALGSRVDAAVLAEERARLEEGVNIPLRTPPDIVRLLKERGDVSFGQWGKLSAGSENAQSWLEQLIVQGDIATISIAGEQRYICSDERHVYERLTDDSMARHFVLSRYVETIVSFTTGELAARYAISHEWIEALIADWERDKRIVTAPFAETEEQGKLWTGAKAASRMIRASIVRNRGIQAVPDRYCAWLMMRHRLYADSKLRGPEGVRDVLEQLQGLYLPLSWWESVVLPARIAGYRREDLDLLCASGEVLWLGRKAEGAKEGKVAFFKQDAVELYGPYLSPDVTPMHPELLGRLMQRGASFLTGLCADTGEQPTELMPKLLDLVWQGFVANDQFAPLRLHGNGLAAGDRAKFRSGLGRWYAVEGLSSGQTSSHHEKSVLTWAKHLLRMNGIATRHIAGEQSPYGWDTLSAAYEKMEEWGIVTRGLLVDGVQALQFADKETAELLRQPMWNNPVEGAALLSSADPANPYGVSIDWPETSVRNTFSRKPGNYLLFWQGRWSIWVENRGRKWTVIRSEETDETVLLACIRKLAVTLLREQGMRKLVIETWNGSPIGETPFGQILSTMGAEKDRHTYVIWPSTL